MRKFDILNLIIPVVNIVIFSTPLFPAEAMETCPDPGVAVNGSREGNCCFKGDVLKFFCEDGYKTVGQREIECLAGGSWSGPIPRCRPVGCKFPSRFLDGTVTYENQTDPQLLDYAPDNYILQFQCSEDYQLVGSKILFCAGAEWTDLFPRCVEIRCATPPSIANGTLSVTMGVNKRTVIGSIAKYSCLKGFELVKKRANSLTCELNGTSSLWVGELPKCKALACQYPEIPPNGSIPQLKGINETTLPHRFHLTYECNKGFRLVGTSWNTCKNRRWAFETPKCEVITCYDPGKPQRGWRKGNNFEVGSMVSYTCSYPHKLLGAARRYCLKNGQWSGELTRCTSSRNFCPEPGIPINGMYAGKTYEYLNVEGHVVIYMCNTGFFLVGSDTRVCQPNRVWTGVQPKCLGPYDFDNPTEVSERLKRIVKDKVEFQEHELHIYRDSLLKLTTRTNFTSLEEQEMAVMRTKMLDLNFPGRIVLYFLFDSSRSIGEQNFRTSVEFAKALVRMIGPSPNGARVGALSFNSEAVVQFIPVEMNSTEAVIDALDRILYITGKTDTSDALNTLLTNTIPMTKKFLGTKTRPVVFILTDGKTRMDGHPQLIAEELKEAGVEIYCIGITGSLARASLYKVASPPEEEHVFILNDYNTLSYLTQIVINETTVLCQYPDIPSNGSIPQLKGRNETTFSYGFHLTYECNKGFRLVGTKRNTCDKGIWTFKTPKCEGYYDCGLIPEEVSARHGRRKSYTRSPILGDQQAVDPWAWMAAIFIRNPVTGRTQFKCDGSVIGRQWILTAANCVFDEGRYYAAVLDPETVIIKLGLRHLKNESNLLEFQPLEFKIHESYDPASVYYDIALIKLDRLIDYSVYIRLCLPPEELHNGASLYKISENAFTIGRGYDKKKKAKEVAGIKSEEHLKEFILPIQSDERCREFVKGTHYELTSEMFCAEPGTGDDTCFGNGGPIMQSQLNEEGSVYWVQIGVVSSRIECRMGPFGYYTHVQPLRGWISETMNRN